MPPDSKCPAGGTKEMDWRRLGLGGSRLSAVCHRFSSNWGQSGACSPRSRVPRIRGRQVVRRSVVLRAFVVGCSVFAQHLGLVVHSTLLKLSSRFPSLSCRPPCVSWSGAAPQDTHAVASRLPWCVGAANAPHTLSSQWASKGSPHTCHWAINRTSTNERVSCVGREGGAWGLRLGCWWLPENDWALHYPSRSHHHPSRALVDPS